MAHADETDWHLRGKLGWLWIARAGKAELFAATPSATVGDGARSA